jgi:tagatose-1,6-bisphosphate aldolase non-catalytic subunit AgaZ/GatZ
MTNNEAAANIKSTRSALARAIEDNLSILQPALGFALVAALYGVADLEQQELIQSHAGSLGSKSLFRDIADLALSLPQNGTRGA